MDKNDWSISRKEGKELIIEVFKNIIEENDNVDIHTMCVLMSKELNYNGFFIYRNGKRRNLNNYMKIEFEGIHSFLKKNENIFKIVNDRYIELI